jgi:starvation-inducible DNA-binding protein
MEQLLLALKVSFASSFAFYLKAANYHWNVEGTFFPQFHELFDKIYTEVQGDLDRFAEEIRSLDSYTPASFSRLAELSKIEDETKVPPPLVMVERLLADNQELLTVLKAAYDVAEAENVHGLSNFLAERMDAHMKHGWMLRAVLKSR